MNGLDRWAQFNYFWDNISPTLSIPERQVWLAIFRHANISGVANVSRKRIACMLDVDVRTVSRGIAGLTEARLIGKNKNGFGYALDTFSRDKNVTESDTTITESDINVPVDSDKNVTMCDKNVTGKGDINVPQGVTKMSHNTEIPYRQDIHNIDTNVSKAKPAKQSTIKGTQKNDWKAKASQTLFWDAWNIYPKVNHKGNPKDCQDAWEEAAKEEGGYDVLLMKVQKHLKYWDKKFVPRFAKYIAEGYYNAEFTKQEILDVEEVNDIPF
jgi:hypothetical protein